MSEMVDELEQLVYIYLLNEAPIYTGNLKAHIKSKGNGKLLVSGPSYDTNDAYAKYAIFGTGFNLRKGKDFRLNYRDASGKRLGLIFPNNGIEKMIDYAWILNETGVFGYTTGHKNQYWTNRAIYNACVAYASRIGANVINNLPL